LAKGGGRKYVWRFGGRGEKGTLYLEGEEKKGKRGDADEKRAKHILTLASPRGLRRKEVVRLLGADDEGQRKKKGEIGGRRAHTFSGR